MSDEIVQTLVQLDPSDPLRVKALVDELRTGRAPVVGLAIHFPRGEDNRPNGRGRES
jgi:hypothetical protein